MASQITNWKGTYVGILIIGLTGSTDEETETQKESGTFVNL